MMNSCRPSLVYVLSLLLLGIARSESDSSIDFNATLTNLINNETIKLSDTLINSFHFENASAVDPLCVIMNEASNCSTRIMASDYSKWADRLKAQQFFIISSNIRITDQDYEKSTQAKSFVLRVDEGEFRRKILPYANKSQSFSISCSRLRNCGVMQSPYILYLVSLLVYTCAIVGWIICVKRSQIPMANPQSTLTFFLAAKSFCDFAFTYHIIFCKPASTTEGLDYIMYDVSGFLRPIFEGVCIHFFLCTSMGKWIFKQDVAKCEGSIINLISFVGGFSFAMYHTFNSGESADTGEQIYAGTLLVALTIGIVSGFKSIKFLTQMGRLRIEGMSEQFAAKRFYVYAVLIIMFLSFLSQAALHLFTVIARLSDRAALILCGYEAIERAVLFGILAVVFNPKYFTRDYLLAQIGGNAEEQNANLATNFETVVLNMRKLQNKAPTKRNCREEMLILSPLDTQNVRGLGDVLGKIQYGTTIVGLKSRRQSESEITEERGRNQQG